MDEPAIRMWAWEQLKGFGWTKEDGDGKEVQQTLSTYQRMESADQIAAWVMSGTIPEQPE